MRRSVHSDSNRGRLHDSSARTGHCEGIGTGVGGRLRCVRRAAASDDGSRDGGKEQHGKQRLPSTTASRYSEEEQRRHGNAAASGEIRFSCLSSFVTYPVGADAPVPVV
jgi:hypothetical protein